MATPCAIGTYSASTHNTQSSDCIACDAGEYCYTRGLTAPQAPCAAGYYCPAGSDEQSAEECPAGAYCGAGSSTYTLCGAGTYNPNEVQTSCTNCPAGYYCPDTGMTNPTVCPAGYYCQGTNVVTPTFCPEGTWSSIEGLTSVSDCMMCPYGKWCQWTTVNSASAPMTSSADGQECSALYTCYNSGGSSFT